MKLLSILSIMLLGSVTLSAQIIEPVKWSFNSSKVADKMYEVRLTANIESPWAVYSMHTPEGGPLPTTINFSKNPIVILQGNMHEEGKLQKKQDPTFDVQVRYYKNKVEFVQVVKLKSAAKTTLSGTVEFMACDDERCLPPKTVPFKIELK